MNPINFVHSNLAVLMGRTGHGQPTRARRRGRLVAYLQSVYQHEHMVLAVYQGLALQATHPTQRDLLLNLAQDEARRLERWADIFQQLGASAPADRQALSARAWQQMLVYLGPRCALAWITWVKKRDVHRLTRMLKTLRADRMLSAG